MDPSSVASSFFKELKWRASPVTKIHLFIKHTCASLMIITCICTFKEKGFALNTINIVNNRKKNISSE